MTEKKRIILGISGASGAIYGIRILKILSELGVETHLVISQTARQVIRTETNTPVESLEKIANCNYNPEDLSAPIASGSYHTDGMLIVPCSIKTLSGVANSYADNLMVRAADVCLKEGRPLLLAVRETPFHSGHLHLMQLASRAGAIIFPPIPAFYGKPKNITEMVDQSIGRMLMRLGIPNPYFQVWGESGAHV